jgi:hypothetical protein
MSRQLLRHATQTGSRTHSVRWRRFGGVAALALGAVLTGTVSPAAVVRAAPVPVTVSFATAGVNSWTVPAEVYTATFDVYGAQGGHGAGYKAASGGLGGGARATLPVTPGQTFQITVGGVGGAGNVGSASHYQIASGAGGFNGGAIGGATVGATNDYGSGGGGGGASDVRSDGSSLSDRIIVAGGGGGGGGRGGSACCNSDVAGSGGPGGGIAGGDGTNAPNTRPNGCGTTDESRGGFPLHGAAGCGGTSAAGGAGGYSTSGSLGSGGNGAGTGGALGGPGGGGGGGFYGGGGGDYGDFSGGGADRGGGSGYVEPGAAEVSMSSGVKSGNGEVDIIYQVASFTVNDSTPDITYAGSGWVSSSGRGKGDYQNDAHATTVDGSSFSYNFTGTGVSWITEKGADEGKADVYIDGVYQGRIDCKDSRYNVPQQVVYRIIGLPVGPHTLQVVKIDGPWMLLDALTTQ